MYSTVLCPQGISDPQFQILCVLTLLRCGLCGLVLGRLTSLLELLLLFKVCGGIGGLALTGLNVKLCLVNPLIPVVDSGRRDPDPFRPADDNLANCVAEEV